MNEIHVEWNYNKYNVEWYFHNSRLSINYKITRADRDKNSLIIDGFVKWDGCSNWKFPEQDHIMFHACTLEGLDEYAYLMKFCWTHASTTIENFDK